MKKLLQAMIAILVGTTITGCQENIGGNHSSTNSHAINQPSNESISGQVQVHFVDVGQGQAQIIVSPSGQVMVIDGGNNDDEERMVEYIRSLGIEQIDILIGTHPDADHVGGLDAIIDAFDIGAFYMPPIAVTTQTFRSVLASAKAKDVTIQPAQKGIDLQFDSDCRADVVSPIQKSKDSNEMSVVVKLACGKSSFLFSGDIEGAAEEILVKASNDLDVDVLLVPHHGSDGSTTKEFLEATTPEIGLIQAGKDNSYGHPGKETLKRLKAVGTEIYRTDELGHIVVIANPQTGAYQVNQQSPIISEQKEEPSQTSRADKLSQIKVTANVKDPSPTQNAREEVSVRVVDQDKKPVAHAEVTLTLHFASKETVYTAQTNAQGEASIQFQIGRAKSGYTVKGEILVEKSNIHTTEEISFTSK